MRFIIVKNIILFIVLITGTSAYSNTTLKELPFKIEYVKDKNNNFNIDSIKTKKFTAAKDGDVLNLGVEDVTIWIKLSAKYHLISSSSIFFIDQTRFIHHQMFRSKLAEDKNQPVSYQLLKNTVRQNVHGVCYLLPDTINRDDTFYLKLKANEAFVAKMSVLTKDELAETYSLKDIVFGIYTGVMLIMFIYNLFLFFVVRDISYTYYVVYILFTWITQISLQGYGSKYLWNVDSSFNDYSIVFYSLVGLFFAAVFTISFLNTKLFAPFGHRAFKILILLIIINLGCIFLFGNYIAFIIMQILTVVGAAIALSTSYYVYFKKRFKPAGFYIIAWSILLVGAVLFVLKDYGIIPYNTFTSYLLQIASGIEVLLLSFALADKINYFKKENEIAQVQALNASLENEKLIKEQNIFLESKVKERTEELESANDTLNLTLNNLKSTQSQLVDAEKMAALGQLTAGIAHEINNPINFVTSNVKPLQLDIDDLKDIITKYENIDLTREIEPQIVEIEAYKKQIDLDFINNEIASLLAGISEGAKRTAEIIRSLRNFSRVDETDMKAIDINEGLVSTLVLVRNNLPDNLTVIKDLGNLPKVECMPGKINQIFMNLISNAIQAVKSKEVQAEEEFLTIKSWYSEQQVFISIKDSGMGMSDEVKHRIFEPFFTTKDIGEGTGLGLSIVFSIIEKHKGHIEVISKEGKGTEFIITLNVNIL